MNQVRRSSSAGAPAARPERDQLAPAQLLEALRGPFPQVPRPSGYVMGVVLLAASLVLLLALYAGLLGFVAYLLGRIARRALAMAAEQSLPLALLVYTLPLLIGLTVLLFLIKPLFVRLRETDLGVRLDPAHEPTLFAYVHKLADLLGAPRPAQIVVDTEPNAAASLRRGLLSVVRDDLVLRLGLPLVAAFNVQQLSGIIAHELAHFSQRGGMRATYLVRRVNFWLERVVFERDGLDLRLERLRCGGAGRALYLSLAPFVGMARGVLWLLLLASEALSCRLLRHMEFDADRYEAHLAGSARFILTARVLNMLAIARYGAGADLDRAWQEKRLADDLPALLVANAVQLPAELRRAYQQHVTETRTGWFDTHPSQSQRIAAAETLGAAPLLRCEAPSKRLFRDFAATCRAASLPIYRAHLGDKFQAQNLVPTAKLVRQLNEERAAQQALRRFYRNQVNLRRLQFPQAGELRGPASTAAGRQLRAAREAMLAAAPAASAALRRQEQAERDLYVARAKLLLLGTLGNLPVLGLSRGAVEQDLAAARRRMEAAEAQLGTFEHHGAQRLGLGLRLLQSPAVAARLGEQAAQRGPGQADWTRLLIVARKLDAQTEAIESIRVLAAQLDLLLALLPPGVTPPEVIARRILDIADELTRFLLSVRDPLAAVAYPFDHAEQGVSVGTHLLEQAPDPRDPWMVFACAEQLLERYFTLKGRMLAVLTELAERVETALGLPALADVKDQKDPQEAAQEREAEAEQRRLWRRTQLGFAGRAAAGIAVLALLAWLTFSDAALPAMPSWPRLAGPARRDAGVPGTPAVPWGPPAAEMSGGPESNGMAWRERFSRPSRLEPRRTEVDDGSGNPSFPDRSTMRGRIGAPPFPDPNSPRERPGDPSWPERGGARERAENLPFPDRGTGRDRTGSPPFPDRTSMRERAGDAPGPVFPRTRPDRPSLPPPDLSRPLPDRIAREREVIQRLRSVQAAVQAYHDSNGQYPPDLSALLRQGLVDSEESLRSVSDPSRRVVYVAGLPSNASMIALLVYEPAPPGEPPALALTINGLPRRFLSFQAFQAALERYGGWPVED